CSNDGTTTSGAEINACAVTTTGTQTVLAGDRSGTGTGSYVVYVQRTGPAPNGPVGATATGYGNTHSGILALSQMGAYTFSGTIGEKVLVRLGDAQTGGDFLPRVRIYGPNGSQVCANDGDGNGAEINTCTLTATGTHSVLAGDTFVGVRTSVGSTGTGNYGLHLQRTNGPIGAIPTSYGNSHSGTLALAQM